MKKITITLTTKQAKDLRSILAYFNVGMADYDNDQLTADEKSEIKTSDKIINQLNNQNNESKRNTI